MNLTLAKALDRWVGGALCRVIASARTLRDLVAPPQEIVEPRTLLLVKFWGLGNVVLLLPVIRSLRRRFPSARIVFVSLRRNQRLLDGCADLDARIYVDDSSGGRLVLSSVAGVLAARREAADL